jgi:hypothetical protein
MHSLQGENKAGNFLDTLYVQLFFWHYHPLALSLTGFLGSLVNLLTIDINRFGKLQHPFVEGADQDVL